MSHEIRHLVANEITSSLCFQMWLDLYMCDIGLPFDCSIPVAEDNSATRLIAHAGQLTRNVRHVAIKTLSLQHAVRNHLLLFRQVKTDDNRADHFTKALPLAAFRRHTDYMLGMRFITTQHAAAVANRNNETFGSRGGGMSQTTQKEVIKDSPVCPSPE